MIDPATHEAFMAAIFWSREKGVSLIEGLDKYGLLLTESRAADIAAEPLNVLAVMLRNETPEAVVRWHYGEARPVTGREMFDAMIAWLDDTSGHILRGVADVGADDGQVAVG